jgi:hypothetical protein
LAGHCERASPQHCLAGAHITGQQGLDAFLQQSIAKLLVGPDPGQDRRLELACQGHGSHRHGNDGKTGKPQSAKLVLSDEQLGELRDKHAGLENWWRERFGFGFGALTQSEARYLARTGGADTIRNRIAEARQGQDGGDR